MSGTLLRVLLADDHQVVLSGIRNLLAGEQDIEIVGEALTAREAVRLAHLLRPDLVLLDVRFGPEEDAGGIDACRQIISANPETNVIMFTSYGDRESVLASVLAGAKAYLIKNVGRTRFLESIRAVGRGEVLLDSQVTLTVVNRLAELSERSTPSAASLSAREKEVLLFITQGLTNKEIADRLVISPFTARNHVIHILNRLGLSRRSEAAAEAIRLHLVGD